MDFVKFKKMTRKCSQAAITDEVKILSLPERNANGKKMARVEFWLGRKPACWHEAYYDEEWSFDLMVSVVCNECGNYSHKM